MKTVLILNRFAGARSATGDDLLQHVISTTTRRSASIEVAETRGRGDAARITREAVASGAERILAVGGDGTLSQCVNGYLEAGAGPAELGLIPVGTGRDFVRSLWRDGRHGVNEALDRVLGGVLHRVDAARLSRGSGESPSWFINAASIGLGGRVADRVEQRSWAGLKRVIGRRVFALATLRELADRPNWTVQVEAGDGGAPITTEVSLVVVANGRFFGGAMEVAPDARVDDGMLDVVTARAMPSHQLVGLLLAVYRGRHLRHPLLSVQRTNRVRLTMPSGVPAPLEADGEPAGRLPVTIEVVPAAVRMRV